MADAVFERRLVVDGVGEGPDAVRHPLEQRGRAWRVGFGEDGRAHGRVAQAGELVHGREAGHRGVGGPARERVVRRVEAEQQAGRAAGDLGNDLVAGGRGGARLGQDLLVEAWGGVALRHAERHGPADRVRQAAHPRDLVRKALVVVAGHARWRDLEQARAQLAERGADAEQLVVVGERPRHRGAVERLVEAGTRRREPERARRDPLLHERGHRAMSSAVAGSLRAPRSPIT